MKKISVLFSAALILFSGICISCHDNIFELINKEVKLEKNGLNGDGKIIRWGDCLLFCNGRIYYKTAESSNKTGKFNKQWRKASSPCKKKAAYIPANTYFIAASSDTLYSLVYEWDESSSGTNFVKRTSIWYTQDKEPASWSWKELSLPDYLKADKAVKVIFGNKAPESDKSRAFATIRDSSDSKYYVYELTGTSVTKIADGTNNAGSNTISAVYFPKDGKTYFMPYYTAAANDKYIYYSTSATNISNHVTASSHIYYADGFGKYTDEQGEEKTDFILGSGPKGDVGCNSGGILSMALTSDYILLGTTSGLYRTPLTENIPSDKCEDFTNNGNSIITEYIFCVFTLDPSAAEGTDDEYCVSSIYGSVSGSADSWTDAGLYSYYKGRGTWNRDGTNDNSTNGN
ncbi:MAG: hypothetical protein J6Z17_05650 [Treponema sp.]|nr:hypothetical protein [Treponema sp.]